MHIVPQIACPTRLDNLNDERVRVSFSVQVPESSISIVAVLFLYGS